MTTLSSNGLSRILEIPLSLLDADTNQKFNNKNATDQLFWLSTTTNASNTPNTINTATVTTGNNTSTPTVTNQCENNNSTEVTHSFANRKRSIVKRRKSVLSASYTAQDEAEAIKSDREATLATLERGTKEEPKKDNILIEDITAPQDNRGDLGVKEEQQQKEKDKSKNTIYNMEQITPKDSAIDLRTTTLEPEDLKIMETSSPIIESTSFTSLTPPSPTLTPAIVMTTKKKKASSWSPRKMFQSNTRKKEPKPEKFNITSLFSRSLPKKPLLKTTSKSVLINSSNETTTKKPEFQLKSNFNYTRLPIHTERAIYRLSHMKLTNPRRPLRDQVTISNLMFWYLSIISQQNHNNNNNNENDLIPSDMQIDHTMTKKSCRIQIQHRRTTNKKRNAGGNKRIRNHQIGPDLHHSNAMDTLNNKQRYKNTHLRTSNSSSDEEEEDEGFSDDDLSDIEDESIPDLYNDKKKKKGKYSLFQKNHHWLSFSSKQNERQDEDDIPLAMYQKGKTP
ncbi:hypothetical protein INT48_007465 [Thamnidium elegans]|uniref:Protein Zds1 C-terminal domain-containing protein n=1 Tax=Thamnidium elegans TaxID=101142 RepID=A0A8H7SKX5_9FUNG|nr:hypothetical protein INT48_007465 [Thamnidium elegans]